MFTSQERTAILSLAAIMALRMLGLFIMIPVFSPYLQTLANATPMLIGLTMGIYGLTQAILQIPFGILSDYIGRREVITLGLVLFFIGSIISGSSHNIWWMLVGRALQGSGAISGTVIALLSDLTSEQVRTKAMAILGMSIGTSFMLSFILGPILNGILDISNIFYLIALLVLPILYILWRVVPADINAFNSQDNILASYKNNTAMLLANKKLYTQIKIHSFGVLSLHGILMANFVVIPILLKNLGLSGYQQGIAYIEVFLLAICIMVPMLIFAEKLQKQKSILIISVLLLILSELIFWLFYAKFWGIMFGLMTFFVGFNILEASLPSIISKLAPKSIKGTVLGFYSTAQFLGPMIGGLLAGILFKYYDLSAIFILGLVWASIWFIYLPNVTFVMNDENNVESN